MSGETYSLNSTLDVRFFCETFHGNFILLSVFFFFCQEVAEETFFGRTLNKSFYCSNLYIKECSVKNVNKRGQKLSAITDTSDYLVFSDPQLQQKLFSGMPAKGAMTRGYHCCAMCSQQWFKCNSDLVLFLFTCVLFTNTPAVNEIEHPRKTGE